MNGTVVHAIKRNAEPMNPPSKDTSSSKKTPSSKRNRLSSVTTAIRLLKAFSEDEVEIGVELGIAKHERAIV